MFNFVNLIVMVLVLCFDGSIWLRSALAVSPETYMCYECDRGTKEFWHNKLCRPNGYIAGWSSIPIECNGPCVSVVTKVPVGGVLRGCSSTLYANSEAPLTGCVKHTDENTYCFCTGHLCNDVDISQTRKEYLSTYT